MKNADFILISSDSNYVIVGNDKGNLVFLDLSSNAECMVIVGKHSKSILSGVAWKEKIALGSDDRSISISNCNGDTLHMISNLKGSPSQLNVICFIKTKVGNVW